jgi:hypothetical protein
MAQEKLNTLEVTPPALPQLTAATPTPVLPSSDKPTPPPPPAAAEAGATADPQTSAGSETSEAIPETPRRTARRRPAGPVRRRVAANDDAPSIGGLIYALEQKPSIKPFKYAAIASVAWGVIGCFFGYMALHPDLSAGAGLIETLAKPATFMTFAAIIVPIAVVWFLALLGWRAEELRLRSSTMTEVAIRLAEPDRMAEQSVASLGQAVRRQVAFMNDAVSRTLGRAGELEALVHNEVAALERSYEDNERKIRGLIQELSGERHALLNTSERVTDTLKTLGTEVPTLIEKLSAQQVKLSGIIQGAGENLSALESAIGSSTDRLESTLGGHSEHVQKVLEGYTTALASALGSRTEQMQAAFEGYLSTLDTSLGNRTENLQTVFEEYARALDTTLANRAQALDIQIVERTRSLETAFAERLQLFDQSIMRSTNAIDSAVTEKAEALTKALEKHAQSFRETIGRQAADLDESLMHGINAVRRTSENITRQSMKAIENLANQSDLLKNVSENLFGQINHAASKFETQGSSILQAANALENANYKIDETFDKLSGKADEFGRFIQGYSSSLEGSLSEAELRARAIAEELRATTENRSRATMADIERLRAEAAAESDRVLADLRNRFSSVSNEVTQQLGTITNQFTETSSEMRQRAARAVAEIQAEQDRIREQLERMPSTSHESIVGMRRSLQDQLKALEQLSQITQRTAAQRDVMPPLPAQAHAAPQPPPPARALSSLSSTVAQELSARQRPPTYPPGANFGGPEQKEGWSLGDLLARASLDDDAPAAPRDGLRPAPAPNPNEFPLNVEIIARALDAATASAIWSRLRAGQRGIMVRSIYSAEGRVAFDEISRRVPNDPVLSQTINRYLSDFERILRDSESQDPSGRLAQNHLVSDTGRVYLFLAHASGHIT